MWFRLKLTEDGGEVPNVSYTDWVEEVVRFGTNATAAAAVNAQRAAHPLAKVAIERREVRPDAVEP